MESAANPSELLDEKRTRLELGGIHYTTLWRIAKRGEIQITRIGGRIFFSRKAIAEYLERVTFPKKAA